MILHDALEFIGLAVHRVWLVRLGLDRLWLARLAAPPGLGSSRDHSKCQTCLPAVSWVSPVSPSDHGTVSMGISFAKCPPWDARL